MRTRHNTEAVRVLSCGHSIPTGLPMALFRTRKGEMTTCPSGCGQHRTQAVKAGESISLGFETTTGKMIGWGHGR